VSLAFNALGESPRIVLDPTMKDRQGMTRKSGRRFSEKVMLKS
jgi:hypothetical protein